MIVIYKYELALKSGRQIVTLPCHSIIQHVHEQNGKICFWANVDTEASSLEERHFHVFATGEELPNYGVKFKYLGTVHINGYVWHIHEEV